MSRTYAHRPAWVQKHDPSMPTRVTHNHTRGECRVESFEAEREYNVSRPSFRRWRNPQEFAPCSLEWARGYGWQVSKIYGQHVDNEACNNYERQYRSESRQLLNAARRDYNMHGETEMDVPPARHRHKAIWYYW